MPHPLTSQTTDSEIALIDVTTPALPLAERVAQGGGPILLTRDGEPLAVVIAVADLDDLAAEVRCLRTLYAVATQQPPRR